MIGFICRQAYYGAQRNARTNAKREAAAKRERAAFKAKRDAARKVANAAYDARALAELSRTAVDRDAYWANRGFVSTDVAAPTTPGECVDVDTYWANRLASK